MSSPILILGGGLAGASLAWRLHARAVPFVLIDRETGDGSSRVAAGLLTPVTGQRSKPSWRFDELFPVAEAFYREAETATGRRFFHQKRAVRLFRDAEEAGGHPERVLLDPDDFDAPHGGFEMDAAHLEVSEFLDASIEFFRARGSYRQADLEIASALGLLNTENNLVLCRGDFGRGDPWFGFLPFRSAKGEVLTLRIPGLREDRIVHAGIWLLPLGDDLFRVGSTYRREWADAEPTDEAREEILGDLHNFLKRPFEVVSHRAGIRPIIGSPSQPTIGFHPQFPRLAFFNGLGSKGCLLAPYFADRLADMLIGKAEPIVLRSEPPVRIRPTEEVHRLLRATLGPGEIAIDATAGNGQDTVFLARCVGPTGMVFAFDVQEEALNRTRSRIEAEGIGNVTLMHHSHAELRSLLSRSLMGMVGAVVFNLGYLPRGDKAVTTQVTSTLPALAAALELLRPGGLLTVVAYSGHPGGREESDSVAQFFDELGEGEFAVTETASDPDREDAPRLFTARRVEVRL